MKIRNILLISAIAALPTSVSADSFLSEKSVKYSGETTARKVCKAVVHDDPGKLDMLFRQDLSRDIYRYSRRAKNRARNNEQDNQSTILHDQFLGFIDTSR